MPIAHRGFTTVAHLFGMSAVNTAHLQRIHNCHVDSALSA